MRFTILLIGLLLLPAAAFADFEFWNWDSVSGEFEGDNVRVVLPEDQVPLRPHGLVEGMNYGMYFGAGDEFILGGAGYLEGEAHAGHSSHDSHVPHGNYLRDFGNFGYDNVYGPMWGVPADTFWGNISLSLEEIRSEPQSGPDYYHDPYVTSLDEEDDWFYE